MNTDVMFSSKNDVWETPQELFDELNDIHHFTCDVCALPENAKCEKFYSPRENGLVQKWGGAAGAIPHMAGRSGSGLKRHTRPIARLLCCFRREPTQNGFTISA